MASDAGESGAPAPREFMHRVNPSAVSEEISGLIYSIRDLDARVQESAMTGVQVKEAVAEMYPPAVLFAPKLMAMPAVYSSLRDWLNSKGANLSMHSSRRVIMTLASSLYDENEDREAAMDIAGQLVAEGRRSSRTATEATSAGAEISTRSNIGAASGSPVREDRTAHNIGMRFKEKDSKFSGDIGQSWIEYVAEYQQVARDYGLSHAQKKQYLHNILRGDAKRFYLDQVDNQVNNFNLAVQVIDNEYNSVVRQNRVKTYLATLRLSKFVTDGLDELAALEKVYKLITKLSPQVPQSHRGEAHKIEFIRNATVGFSWATEPLSRISTHGLSFQQIYGELEAALHLEREARVAVLRDKASSKAKTIDSSTGEVPGILFEGQGRYMNRNRGIGDRKSSKYGARSRERQPRRSFDPLVIMGCFNCDDPSHMLNKCPKPIDATRAAKKKIEYISKKTGNTRNAHVVLYELCAQIDSIDELRGELDDEEEVAHNEVESDHSVDEDLSDFDLFEALVSYVEMECDPEVIEVNLSARDFSSKSFNGACMDIGATRTVVGKPQAEAYYRIMGIQAVIKPSARTLFKFGKNREPSIGKAQFRIPYARGKHMDLTVDVVNIDVPLLIGLDSLDKYKLYIDSVDNLLVCKDPEWSCPVVRKNGHIYYEWMYDVMYTESELRRIHRHFYHPKPDRLFALMKRAKDPDATKDTLDILHKVSNECEVCQKLAGQPSRFRVSLPNENVVFNRKVLIDLMYLGGKSVLHIICNDTLFSAAVFLQGESTNEVWTAYVRNWVNPYVGYSKEIHTDKGPQFDSDRWKQLLQACGIKNTGSGIESHNALGAGERYHEFLRTIFRKVQSEHPKLLVVDCLSLAVHAMNSTAGPNGLVPILLVFGVIPQIPFGFSDVPEQRERMRALKRSRDEMVKAVAKNRLRTAISRKVPSAADSTIRIGSNVLFYRETSKQWEGPYLVVAGDEKKLWLSIKGSLKEVSIDKVKEFIPAMPNMAQKPSKPDDPPTEHRSEREMSEIDQIFDQIITGEAFLSHVHNRLATVRESTEGNAFVIDTPSPIMLTERFRINDRRSMSPEFIQAKKDELRGLKSRGTWKLVHVSKVPKNSNVIGGRFVCEVKKFGTSKAKAKARYIGQGFGDELKDYIVHNNPSLRHSSVKLLVSMASVMKYRIASLDFVQAYLQSGYSLSRKIYVKPKLEDLDLLGIGPDIYLELLKPLYGICDSGDYWGATFNRYLKGELQMIPTDGDPALHTLVKDSTTTGILGAYVDDTMFAVGPGFDLVIDRIRQKFDSKSLEWDDVDFLGIRVETNHISDVGRSIDIHQPEYLAKLSEMPSDVSYERFRSVRACVAWLSHSRPDLCCSINRAAQVTRASFEIRHVKELNKAIRFAKNNKDIRLSYRELEESTLHLRTYADASFATNDDGSSQLGFIILLCDSKNDCHILSYSSRKSRRVVRSIMAGETYAFTHAFDHAYIIKRDVEKILRKKIPLRMFTDSKQLFDVITKASHPTERRLMIDIASVREAYDSFEISNVGLVSGAANPADALTKPNFSSSLLKIISDAKDNTPVLQWIFRTRSKTTSSHLEKLGV